MVDLDQHIDIVSFVVEGCFKFHLSTVTPNDPKMTSDQKFLNTPKKSLPNDLFTQVSSMSIELGSYHFLPNRGAMKKLMGHRIFSLEKGGSQKNQEIIGWLQILMTILFNE